MKGCSSASRPYWLRAAWRWGAFLLALAAGNLLCLYCLPAQIDVTSRKVFTLAPQTRNLLLSLEAPVEAIEKSGPVPVNATTCGLPVALSLIEIEALRAPIPVGVNVTPIWQLAAAASEAPQPARRASGRANRPVPATPRAPARRVRAAAP